MSDRPEQPQFQVGFYRHYKGGLYEALGLTLHSETMEWMVRYRHFGEELEWSRPLKMWNEEIGWPDGKPAPRFRYEMSP